MVTDYVHGVLDASSNAANEAKKEEGKQAIITLGCEYGLVTPYTSMIAVEERTEGSQVLPQLNNRSLAPLSMDSSSPMDRPPPTSSSKPMCSHLSQYHSSHSQPSQPV
jgi:hypothetical protein